MKADFDLIRQSVQLGIITARCGRHHSTTIDAFAETAGHPGDFAENYSQEQPLLGLTPTWRNNAFAVSTRDFHLGSMSDTFTVTVTAPPSMRIARVIYEQAGNRLTERGYFNADGSATLSVEGSQMAFNFQSPNLTRTMEVSSLDLTSATVSIAASIRAYRNSSFPRVKALPGSASISITSAETRVEFE